VRGSTVIKPLNGKIGYYTHGDAAVIKPLRGSNQGLAITADVNPRWVELDPYWGAAAAVDEICRNLVSVGAVPHSLADCLNFGNPEKPERLGDFFQVARGLYAIASVMNISFVSGNVSFYNESHSGAIPPTPTILGVGIIEDVRHAVTADLKAPGSSLYQVGSAAGEMGGSEYYQVRHVAGNQVPRTFPDVLKKRVSALLTAMERGIVASCHDISHGGLGVCLSEMALGGALGVTVTLDDTNLEPALFSESPSRWVVEIYEGKEKEFEQIVGDDAHKLGVVTDESFTISPVITLSLDQVRTAWENTLWRMMG
ncbi:MAG: phosphoribosylformylglycinamidine synthase II, partial [Theionarchaea archaeon]|nr:phosphoribosylformylglycinamidine synthase II [Theionarchaea archaeon]